jgi:homoserine kinase
MNGDLGRIGEAINRDHISEPVRSLYIPGYQALKQRVLAAGAFGVNVSGGGSSVFAVCDKGRQKVVAEAMSLPLEGDKEPPLVLTTKSSNQGVMEIDGL